MGTNKEEIAWWENFWQSDGDPCFHRKGKNHLLVAHLDKMLAGRSNIKILFPMCGKTDDIKWMYDLGHTVVGVEIAEKAIQQLFVENGLTVEVEQAPAVNGKLYKTRDGRIKVYCCSIFDFNKDMEGQFDGVFDSGAYAAVRRGGRQKYADMLVSLMARDCQCLLNTFEFDESFKHFDEEFHDYTLEEIIDTFSSRNCFIELVDILPFDMEGAKDRLHLVTRKS